MHASEGLTYLHVPAAFRPHVTSALLEFSRIRWLRRLDGCDRLDRKREGAFLGAEEAVVFNEYHSFAMLSKKLKHEPSDHYTETFDVLQIQWRSILLLLSPVGRNELRPRYENGGRFLLHTKIVFVAYSCLLPAIVWILGKHLIFQDKSVSLR